MDPYKYLKIRFNPDGSLYRYGEAPLLPAAPAGEPVAVAAEGEDDEQGARRIVVHSNDVPLSDATGTGLRLFVPSVGGHRHGGRLPLVVYFHGGGYVLFRAASEPFHNTCTALAAAAPAVVASVDYRLAPEHRLPAAFEDAADAVLWARPHAAAGSPVFVMGSHNGASIAFRAALAAVEAGVELRGVILNQPHLGGATRSPAEAASVDDRVLPLPANDLLWELALPVGADRDHEYCNPESMLARVGTARLRRLPPCLVLGRRKDPPRDRTRTLVNALQKAGVDVEARLDGAGYHAMELFKANCATEFTAQVADFVRRHSSADAGAAAAAVAGDVVGMSKL
ncbi:putative carboxylesterase 8 [Dichanthelium oligosanthes]|uniref:Putative carboxylesterase 8 n=1 Tax=Dichanthelium oligosanthes TaxID=888268 RepID=A0A1E5WKQ3_9POAL|nr:putative carboxylesterase 8 [Dichanthelium oligosanthes]